MVPQPLETGLLLEGGVPYGVHSVYFVHLGPLSSARVLPRRHNRPFEYLRVTYSQDARRLAVNCDRVMLVMSWKSKMELIVANS